MHQIAFDTAFSLSASDLDDALLLLFVYKPPPVGNAQGGRGSAGHVGLGRHDGGWGARGRRVSVGVGGLIRVRTRVEKFKEEKGTNGDRKGSIVE